MYNLSECPKCLIKPEVYKDGFGRTVIECPKCGRKTYGAVQWEVLNRSSKIYLDACPFCGERGEIEQFGRSEYVVECQGCWCRTQVEDTPEEAAEKWNMRYNFDK